MNIFLAEQMRIIIQCTQTANQQCQKMMLFPWMYWLPQQTRSDDE